MSMAAPMNSGESDMVTEDFLLNLSPLLSPRWSLLCLTPSPPRSFLPSSSSMVIQYQGCNQSMDNPPQNQEDDNIVDPLPYLAGDSALLQQQQQLRKDWSEASSDWRPRGGGIMTMNNQGFEESNMGFEEESEGMMMKFISFPPSPTDFPLYRPLPSLSNSTVFSVSDLSNQFEQSFSLVLSNEQDTNKMFSNEQDMNKMEQVMNKLQQDTLRINEYKSSLMDAIMNANGMDPPGYDGGFASYVQNNVNDLDRILGAEGRMSQDVVLLAQKIIQEGIDYDEMEILTFERKNWSEQFGKDIVDQPVLEMVGLVQQLIQKRGAELNFIPRGGVCTINGLEHCDSQDLPMTMEPSIFSQTKFAVIVWLGYGGQWVTEIRVRNRLNYHNINIGSFNTTEDTSSAHEMVMRFSGWADLTGFSGHFQKANRSKLPLQLPPPAQEKPDEEAHQARLNLGKRKTKEKNPGGERRNKKTNGVRIAIPVEDILQTKGMRLKDATNHLEVGRSTLEHNLISCPNETPATVDQEGIPQLNFDTLPSDQALAATVGTNNVVVKEIRQQQFSLTDRQDNPDDDFGNYEVEMGNEGTREGEMEEGQLNSGCLGKGKSKVGTPGGDRGSKKTNKFKKPISLEAILQAGRLHLNAAAEKFEVSRSTLKRVCRGYGIHSWPPSNGNEHISQSYHKESPALVDQEGVQQLNCDILPSDQALAANVDTNSVF